MSEGGTRYFDVNNLLGLRELETDLTVAYARVSSHDQKEDLNRQAENLEITVMPRWASRSSTRTVAAARN